MHYLRQTNFEMEIFFYRRYLWELYSWVLRIELQIRMKEILLVALVLSIDALKVAQWNIRDGSRQFQILNSEANDVKTDKIIFFFHPFMLIPKLESGEFNTSSIRARFGLDNLVEQSEGTLAVVIPIGLPGNLDANAWNAGICCQNNNVDDLEFVRVVTESIKNHSMDYGIFLEDDNKFYAAGFSNGAGFVQYLLCHSSIEFEAIASISGPFSGNEKMNCPGLYASKTDLLLIHGRRDTITLWTGEKGLMPAAPVPFPENVQFWAENMQLKTDWITPSIVKSEIFGRRTLVAIGLMDGGHDWIRNSKFDTTKEMANFFKIRTKSFDEIEIPMIEEQFFRQNHNASGTVWITVDPTSNFFKGNAHAQLPVAVWRESIDSNGARSELWSFSIEKESFQNLTSQYNICAKVFLSWGSYPTTSIFEAQFDCHGFGDTWNFKDKKGSLHVLLIFAVPKEMQKMPSFSISWKSQDTEICSHESPAYGYDQSIYKLESNIDSGCVFLSQETPFLKPFLRKTYISVVWSQNSSFSFDPQSVFLGNHHVKLKKSSNKAQFTSLSIPDIVGDSEIFSSFIKVSNDLPPLIYKYSVENSYCPEDLFDWTRKSDIFFKIGSACDKYGFLISGNEILTTINALPGNQSTIYGIFRSSNSYSTSASAVITLNTRYPVSISYSYDVNRIPNDEYSQIWKSNYSESLSLQVPFRFLKQIVIVRLEFKESTGYPVHLNITAQELFEQVPDDSRISFEVAAPLSPPIK
jgi:poly(3-hydroxybutyrate) depolymerase